MKEPPLGFDYAFCGSAYKSGFRPFLRIIVFDYAGRKFALAADASGRSQHTVPSNPNANESEVKSWQSVALHLNN